MNNGIPHILNDLYEIDPSLRQHEPELINIVQRIMRSKPDTQFDRMFAEKLRSELLDTLKRSHAPATKQFNNLFSFMPMKKFSFALSGVLVLVLIMITSAYFMNGRPSTTTRLALRDTNQQFRELAPNAFGALSGGSLPSQGSMAQPEKMLGLGGGGGGVASSPMPALDTMRPYEYVRYVYQYVGDAENYPGSTANVYSRRIDTSQQGAFRTLTSNLGLGVINLKGFSDLHMMSVGLKEPKENGFSFDINMQLGVINMYRQSSNIVMEQQQQGIRPNQLSDSELISIAGQFMTRYNIDAKNYGAPIVNKDWLRYTDDPTYVPDTMTIVYPEVIDGQMTYDFGGIPQGLTIGVDLATKQVQYVNNLGIQQYDRSEYSVENDIKTLVDRYATNMGYAPTDVAVKDLSIELGNPTMGLTLSTQFINGQPEQLYIPAYIFPVLNKPDPQYYVPDQLVIPLLDNFYGSPMPFIK